MDFNRVAKWNSARYNRELNVMLQHKLAHEEYTETVNAPNDVERLDGHIDQIYVAMGGLWKMNIDHANTQYVLETSEHMCNIMTADLSYYEIMDVIATHVEAITCTTGPRLALLFANICNFNYLALECLGYTREEANKAAEIVCDSNDSKSVKKVATDVKANDGDKGAFFIDPTPRLQVLVDAMLARRV